MEEGGTYMQMVDRMALHRKPIFWIFYLFGTSYSVPVGWAALLFFEYNLWGLKAECNVTSSRGARKEGI